MLRFPKATFFKMAEGYGGHTMFLALFYHRGEAGKRVDCDYRCVHLFLLELLALEASEGEEDVKINVLPGLQLDVLEAPQRHQGEHDAQDGGGDQLRDCHCR